MNILLVTETYLPWITGVSISTNSIAKFMAGHGNKVTILTPKPAVKGKVAPIKDVRIIHVPTLSFTFYNNAPLPILPLVFYKVLMLLGKEDFDIIHIQEPGITGFSTLIAAKIKKIPVSGYLHFIPEQIDRVLWGKAEYLLTPIINIYVKIIYNSYDAVETPSYFFANYLKSIGVKKQVNVISNGVDTRQFHPDRRDTALREKYGIKNDETLFFYLGRLDGDKNVETLVRAMEFAGNKVKLLIVGKGKKSEFLHKLAERLNVSGKIVWVDYIDDLEMPNYYLVSDCFVIMSPYEGQSIVTLQAVSSGLPVIAAKAGALPELVKDNVNGFLLKTYDVKGLAQKMNVLAKDKKLREIFGLESRKISLNHEKEKVLGKLKTIFDKLGKRKYPSRQGSIS